MVLNDSEVTTYVLKAELSSQFVTVTADMTHPYPALKSTSDLLNKCGIPRYNLVDVGQYGFQSIPLVSFGYKFCDAIVLRSKALPDMRGLAHVTSGFKPDEYVDALHRLFGAGNIEALVIKS